MMDANLPPTKYEGVLERLAKPPAYVQELSPEQLRALRGPLKLMIAQSNSTKTDPRDYSNYKTVEDVLNDTPYFKTVRLEDIQKEILADNKVVLILYSPTPPQEPSINTLLMFKAAVQHFPDIKFLALRYEGPSKDREYAALGFNETPGYAFYSGGRRVYLQTKGPSKDELNKGIEITIRNLTGLRNLGVRR